MDLKPGRKSKLIWTVVLFLLAGSWIGNIAYYYSMQLEKPLFLKHYMRIDADRGEGIQFTFLENKREGRTVTGVQIDELPGLRFQISERNNHTHQLIKRAYGEWLSDEREQEQKEPLIVREITVFYNTGQSEKVSIGEINVVRGNGRGLLNMISTRGSSNGTGEYSVIIQQSAKLVHVDYAYKERISPWFTLELAGEPVQSLEYPLELLEGEQLAFSYRWSIPDDESIAYEVYNTKILLTFELEDGSIVNESIPVNFNYHLNDGQIKRLVRSGGEP